MTRTLINVYDGGLFYVVNNAFVSEEYLQNFTNTVTTIEIRDTATFAAIVDALSVGKRVKVPKNVDPLSPGDLIIDVDDELTAAKNSGTVKITNFANGRVGNVNTYIFFKFSILDNILRSKGYSITEANREEQYLLILETADEFLIETLQSFLEAQDKISEMNDVFTQAETALVSIEEAATVIEVDTIVNTFLSQFN